MLIIPALLHVYDAVEKASDANSPRRDARENHPGQVTMWLTVFFDVISG